MPLAKKQDADGDVTDDAPRTPKTMKTKRAPKKTAEPLPDVAAGLPAEVADRMLDLAFRVGAARARAKKTRAEVAQEMGITEEAYAAVEEATAPVAPGWAAVAAPLVENSPVFDGLAALRRRLDVLTGQLTAAVSRLQI